MRARDLGLHPRITSLGDHHITAFVRIFPMVLLINTLMRGSTAHCRAEVRLGGEGLRRISIISPRRFTCLADCTQPGRSRLPSLEAEAMTNITAVTDDDNIQGDASRDTGETRRGNGDGDAPRAPERANSGFCWWRWRGWELTTTAADDEASS